MPTYNISRKFHLGNIKEWLALVQTPLRKAQEATAIALKEHWEDSNTDAMVGVTDVANAINTALVWVMCAQDMVRDHLQEVEGPPEDTLEPEVMRGIYLECTHCGVLQPLVDGASPGDVCPVCGDGSLEDDIPF